jgi:2-keto-4-pentenoate hydratase
VPGADVERLRDFAERLRRARRNLAPTAQLTTEAPHLSVPDAYAIQELLTSQANRTGYKMGLTSLAKQREVGVSTPIRGYLLGEDAIDDGGFIQRHRYIHPRAEPEIVFVLKRDLAPDAPVGSIRAAIETVHIGLEIIDSRYRNFRFTLPDVIADNTSAAGYVIGEPISWSLEDLAALPVRIFKNSHELHRATGAAILGDPIRSIEQLLKLTPGGVKAGPVLAGGVTPSVPFVAGDTIEAYGGTRARAWFRVV